MPSPYATAAWLLLGHHIVLVAPYHDCDVAGPRAAACCVLRAATCLCVASSCVTRALLTPVPPVAEQELLAWAFAALTCGWPELPGAVVSGARRERFTRVAVLADPQLTDMTSYRTASSGPLLLVRSACAPRGAAVLDLPMRPRCGPAAGPLRGCARGHLGAARVALLPVA
jgi:hypothetical protein